MAKVSGIYKITNTVNGKVYIGQSVDIEQRFADEIKKQRVNKHLKNAFNKYGIDNFTFETLLECPTNQLNDEERRFIAQYDSANPAHGYNRTHGGKNAYAWSKYAALDMRGEKNPFYGRKHTPATIKKLSEISSILNKGRKHREDTKRKQAISKIGGKNPNAQRVYQYTKDSELIGCYDSISVAALATGIGSSTISNCVSGISQSAGGYIWSKTKLESPVSLTNKRLRAVRCVETGIVYPSVAEASKSTGIASSKIYKSCYRGETKWQRTELKWEYVD